MTIGVGLVVPGEGCVLACDSRVLAGHSIVSDTCEKFALCGSATALVAGADGGLMDAIAGSRNFAELHHRALSYSDGKPLSWELLVWDRRTQSLQWLDNHGSRIEPGRVAGIGAGGDLALGYLDGCSKPRSLAQAAKLALGAVSIACARNSACGGAQRLLVVRGKRGAPEVY